MAASSASAPRFSHPAPQYRSLVESSSRVGAAPAAASTANGAPTVLTPAGLSHHADTLANGMQASSTHAGAAGDSDYQTFVSGLAEGDSGDVFVSDPDLHHPAATNILSPIVARPGSAAAAEAFMGGGGSRSSSPVPLTRTARARRQFGDSFSNGGIGSNAGVYASDTHTGGASAMDTLPPDMVAYLRAMFETAAGGRVRELVPRDAMRATLQDQLESSASTHGEYAHKLLKIFDRSVGPQVSLEDLCHVFLAMAQPESEPAPQGNGSGHARSPADDPDNSFARISMLQEELDRSRLELDEMRTVMERKHEEQARTARRIEEEGAEQIRLLQTDNERLIDENKALKTQVRELTKEKEGAIQEQEEAADGEAEDRAGRQRRTHSGEAEMRTLRRANAELLMRVRDMEVEVMRKRNEREQAQASCAQYAATVAQMQTRLDESEAAQQRCVQLEQENARLRVEVQDWEMASRDREAAAKDMISRRSLIALEDDLRQAMNAAVAAEAETRRARESEAQARAALAQLQGAATSYETELATLLAHADEYKQANEILEQQLQATAASVTELTGECEGLGAEVAKARDRIRELEARLAEADAARAGAAGAKDEVARLQEQVRAGDARYRALLAEQDSLKAQVVTSRSVGVDHAAALTQRADTAERRIVDLTAALAAAEASRGEAQAALAKETSRVHALESELDAAHAGLTAAESEQSLLREQVKNVLASRAAIEERAKQQAEENARKLEEMRGELAEARRGAKEAGLLRATETADLEMALHDAHERLRTMDDGAQTIAHMQQTIDALVDERDRLADQARQAEDRFSRMKNAMQRDLDEARGRLGVLEAAASHAAEESSRRERELRDAQGQARDMQAQHRDLQTQHRDLQTQMRGHEDAAREWQARANVHQQHVAELQGQLLDMEAQARSMQDQVRDRDAAAREHEGRARALEAQTGDMQGQIAALQGQVTALQQQTRELAAAKDEFAAQAREAGYLVRALNELLRALHGELLGRPAIEAMQAAEALLARMGKLDLPPAPAPVRERALPVPLTVPPPMAVPVPTMGVPLFSDSDHDSMESAGMPVRAMPLRHSTAYATPSPPETPKALLRTILTDSIPGMRVENIRAAPDASPLTRAPLINGGVREDYMASQHYASAAAGRAERTRATERDAQETAEMELRRQRRAFEAHTFPVTVLDSTAAARLGLVGQAWLRMVFDEIALLEPKTWEVLAAWPLSHVQQFGKNRNIFSFEAGPLAGPRTGVFYLAGERTNEIFALMNTFTGRTRTGPVLPVTTITPGAREHHVREERRTEHHSNGFRDSDVRDRDGRSGWEGREGVRRARESSDYRDARDVEYERERDYDAGRREDRYQGHSRYASESHQRRGRSMHA